MDKGIALELFLAGVSVGVLGMMALVVFVDAVSSFVGRGWNPQLHEGREHGR